MFILGLLAGLPTFTGGGSDDMPVPVELQLTIFVKVLRFDRSIKSRGGNEVVMGILYQSRVRESYLAKDQLTRIIEGTNVEVQGKRVRTVPVVAGTPEELAAAIAEHRLNLLYVGPVRAVDVAAYARVTRAHSVLSLTGVPRFVEDGLAIGVGLAGDRPEIIINVEAARAEGANLSARLLNLARLIQP